MRELAEVPFPSQYPLIFSEFTMAMCNYVQISWWAQKSPKKGKKNNYPSLYMTIKNKTTTNWLYNIVTTLKVIVVVMLNQVLTYDWLTVTTLIMLRR